MYFYINLNFIKIISHMNVFNETWLYLLIKYVT